MLETDSSTVVILLSSLVGLVVLLLGVVFGIFRCLHRMEKRLSEFSGQQRSSEADPSAAETSAGGAFEAFLNEDASRRKLPKGEQFAEYRRWRQERGLNWTNS